MLDFTKISFNEIDNTDKPLQVFFDYDISETEIYELVEEYAIEDEVPRGIRLCTIELLLSIYSRTNFKLEAVCNSDNSEQFWIELNKQFSNADEFIQLIPDYGKIEM